MQNKKILAISGSLRATSSNTIFLRAIQQIIPVNTDFTIYQDLAALPAFDHGGARASGQLDPATIRGRRCFNCSPEYALGIPGALKNASTERSLKCAGD